MPFEGSAQSAAPATDASQAMAGTAGGGPDSRSSAVELRQTPAAQTVAMCRSKDDVFEAYLESELSALSDKALVAGARSAAQAAYYGAHYRYLFPGGSSEAAVTGQRGLLHQVLSDTAIEAGERLADQFCRMHSERAQQYRVVFHG